MVNNVNKNIDYINKFNGKNKEKLKSFFNRLDKLVTINKKDKRKIIRDFENYIVYLYPEKSISSIIELLDISNFPLAYSKKNEWYPLDNSSKIYPLSMQEDWMSIYRLSYYLKDDIIEEVLQVALLFTMVRFPIFRTSVHKGFFWNYLNGVNKHFKIEKEENTPCSKINISKFGTQAFRVCFYKNRISCEFFHILADAHGGMVFLTTLVNEYLRLLGKKVSYNEYALNTLDVPNKEEWEDAFLKNKQEENKGSLIENKALSLDGKLSLIRPCQVLHFDLDLKRLHDLAKEKDVTINELLLSFLFMVLSFSTSKDGFIKIQVPINIRKYYPTKTIRNFSLYTTISIHKKDVKDFSYVLEEVKKQSRAKITKETIDGLIYHSCHLVKSLSPIPLFIKKPIANFIYRNYGDKSSTTVLSNLGKIDLPKELSQEVIEANFILGTNLTNRILFSVITINDVVNLTISKFTTNKSCENNLYNQLKEHNLIKRVYGSDEYEYRK